MVSPAGLKLNRPITTGSNLKATAAQGLRSQSQATGVTITSSTNGTATNTRSSGAGALDTKPVTATAYGISAERSHTSDYLNPNASRNMNRMFEHGFGRTAYRNIFVPPPRPRDDANCNNTNDLATLLAIQQLSGTLGAFGGCGARATQAVRGNSGNKGVNDSKYNFDWDKNKFSMLSSMKGATKFADFNKVTTEANEKLNNFKGTYASDFASKKGEIDNTATSVNQLLADAGVEGLNVKIDTSKLTASSLGIDVNDTNTLDVAADTISKDIQKVTDFKASVNTAISEISGKKGQISGEIASLTQSIQQLEAKTNRTPEEETKLTELKNKKTKLEDQQNKLQQALDKLNKGDDSLLSQADGFIKDLTAKQDQLGDIKAVKEEQDKAKWDLAEKIDKEVTQLKKQMDEYKKNGDYDKYNQGVTQMQTLDADIKQAGNVTKKGKTYQFKNADNAAYMTALDANGNAKPAGETPEPAATTGTRIHDITTNTMRDLYRSGKVNYSPTDIQALKPGQSAWVGGEEYVKTQDGSFQKKNDPNSKLDEQALITLSQIPVQANPE